MRAYLTGCLFLLAAALPCPLLAGDDHPGLTAADQAYSAGEYEKAAALYRRDAELGLVAAQVNLAFLFLEGEGVPADPAQAAIWFARAAERGNAEAQRNLGVLYREGRGVDRNLVAAAQWFRLAGAAEDAASVEKRLSPEQQAEVGRRVADWRSRSSAPVRH